MVDTVYLRLSEWMGHWLRGKREEAEASGEACEPLAREEKPFHEVHQLAARTHNLAANTTESPDGRLRIRGPECLDICATPGLIPAAIDAFVGWLGVLEEAGIPMEIRCVDGWRVCALVDGVPLAIRVRERLERAPLLGSFSARLEQWMGGRPGTALRPSGRLELQVMRFGISAVSVPCDPSDPEECFQEALQGLLDAARREREYQNELQRRAAGRVLKTALPAPRPDAETASREPAGAKAASPVLPQLLEELQGFPAPAVRALRMSASLTRLTRVSTSDHTGNEEAGEVSPAPEPASDPELPLFRLLPEPPPASSVNRRRCGRKSAAA